MNVIAASVDLRPLFGPARNQGPRPTCLAFAASDAHAALRPGWAPLSCEYAFYQAQRRAARPANTGALLSAMLAGLRENGQPEENDWPYLAATPTDAASWSPPAEIGPLFGRDGEKSSPAIDQVIAELEQGRPVIILTMLSRSFYTPTRQAVINPANGEAPEPARRHAVVAVGHGTVDGQRSILVRNSWGPRWGDAGYGWLTELFLGPRMFAAATLMEEVDVSAHSAAA
jgi:Papain family cysteine protease